VLCEINYILELRIHNMD